MPRAALCTGGGSGGRLCGGSDPCKESPLPSQGTTGAGDLFHVAVSEKGEVLFGIFKLTLTGLKVINGGSYLNGNPMGRCRCCRDPE